MGNRKKSFSLPLDPPSSGRIIYIILMKAFGAYLSLCIAWYIWYFRTLPIVDAYRFIAMTRQKIDGEPSSLFGTLHDIVTGSGAYSFLADASFYLSIIGIATFVILAYCLILWMMVWKQEYAHGTAYQSSGFDSKRLGN